MSTFTLVMVSFCFSLPLPFYISFTVSLSLPDSSVSVRLSLSLSFSVAVSSQLKILSSSVTVPCKLSGHYPNRKDLTLEVRHSIRFVQHCGKPTAAFYSWSQFCLGIQLYAIELHEKLTGSSLRTASAI